MTLKTSKKQQINTGFSQLKVDCSIGVFPHEFQTPQEIFISLETSFCIDLSNWNDALEHTIDYASFASFCREMAAGKHFFLIESLALDILKNLGERYPVLKAKVRIEKPKALSDARYGFVEIE